MSKGRCNLLIPPVNTYLPIHFNLYVGIQQFVYSELKADYKKCSFYGFMMALLVLPLILAKKEDVMDLDDLSGDLNDPDVIEKINQITIARTNTSMSNEPQIGDRISSAFREMVDNGYFIM